jgi:hypothetical protein
MALSTVEGWRLSRFRFFCLGPQSRRHFQLPLRPGGLPDRLGQVCRDCQPSLGRLAGRLGRVCQDCQVSLGRPEDRLGRACLGRRPGRAYQAALVYRGLQVGRRHRHTRSTQRQQTPRGKKSKISRAIPLQPRIGMSSINFHPRGAGPPVVHCRKWCERGARLNCFHVRRKAVFMLCEFEQHCPTQSGSPYTLTIS